MEERWLGATWRSQENAEVGGGGGGGSSNNSNSGCDDNDVDADADGGVGERRPAAAAAAAASASPCSSADWVAIRLQRIGMLGRLMLVECMPQDYRPRDLGPFRPVYLAVCEQLEEIVRAYEERADCHGRSTLPSLMILDSCAVYMMCLFLHTTCEPDLRERVLGGVRFWSSQRHRAAGHDVGSPCREPEESRRKLERSGEGIITP
jgi:hypothetical protein